MSRNWKKLISGGAMIAVAATSIILSSSASPETLPTTAPTTQTPTERRARNLSLQPEAFRLSRRLGARFTRNMRATTTITGTLIAGSSPQMVTIIHRQTDGGESVDIAIGERVLTWRDTEGVRGTPNSPTESERLLTERLILDSPDQFVLAQLRGASYHTVARNVRADVGGSDGYTGPLWDLIRVEEPATEERVRPLSTWRLYCINVRTGLIDKIVSELEGATIEANLLEWIDRSGEKVPSQIIWKRGEETILEFRLATLAIQQQP
jgi:hypothetical protein